MPGIIHLFFTFYCIPLISETEILKKETENLLVFKALFDMQKIDLSTHKMDDAIFSLCQLGDTGSIQVRSNFRILDSFNYLLRVPAQHELLHVPK